MLQKEVDPASDEDHDIALSSVVFVNFRPACDLSGVMNVPLSRPACVRWIGLQLVRC